MRKTEIHKRNNGLKAAIISGLSGLMLALYGLYAPHAHAISVSPDMLESGMDILSLSADCAGENLSDNRLVCQDTLAEISRSHVAGKIADGVINTGMNQLGKLAGKLGMKTFSLATKGALRALGPTGKLMTSWKFGRMVGTQMSEQWVAPRIKQYLQKKAREEGKKIRQQTDLLKADKAVASEYRKLLMERGVDTANAYLDKQFEVASQPAGLKYDVQKELARGERMRKLAKEMDEDAARRRNMERESLTKQSTENGGNAASASGQWDKGNRDEPNSTTNFDSRGRTAPLAQSESSTDHLEGRRRGLSQCDEPGACTERSPQVEDKTRRKPSLSDDVSFCQNLLVRRPELANDYPPPECARIVSEMERFSSSVNQDALSCGDSFGYAIAVQKWSVAANRKCFKNIKNQGIKMDEDVMYCAELQNIHTEAAIKHNKEAKLGTCPGGSRTWPEPPRDW